MTKEEMIERVNLVKSPLREKETLYSIADELGIKYKKSNCPKCCKDLKLIIQQELGVIEDAAELSDFNTNGEYKYIRKNGVVWKGRVYNQNTDPQFIKEFIKHFPKGYYELIEQEDNNNTNNEE